MRASAAGSGWVCDGNVPAGAVAGGTVSAGWSSAAATRAWVALAGAVAAGQYEQCAHQAQQSGCHLCVPRRCATAYTDAIASMWRGWRHTVAVMSPVFARYPATAGRARRRSDPRSHCRCLAQPAADHLGELCRTGAYPDRPVAARDSASRVIGGLGQRARTGECRVARPASPIAPKRSVTQQPQPGHWQQRSSAGGTAQGHHQTALCAG